MLQPQKRVGRAGVEERPVPPVRPAVPGERAAEGAPGHRLAQSAPCQEAKIQELERKGMLPEGKQW